MNTIHFLFPQDMLKPRSPDRMFADQFDALKAAGFSTSIFSSSNLAEGNLRLNIPTECNVVYRGWMLKTQEYAKLLRAVEQCGSSMFTSTAEYLKAHYLPNWYPLISELTPETKIYPADGPIEAELRTLNWGAYFLKDYVKSLKTARGSIVHDPAEAPALLAEMKEYRGEIEGGICVRRVEDFVPDTEQRYFVLNGNAYAASEIAIPDEIMLCSQRIPSPFFSVDLIQRRDGANRVVEVGDGQVSDIVGWTADAFARMWRCP